VEKTARPSDTEKNLNLLVYQLCMDQISTR